MVPRQIDYSLSITSQGGITGPVGAKTFKDKCTKPEISLPFLWTTGNCAEGNNLQLIKEFAGCFFSHLFSSSSPHLVLPKKGENYPRRWRCSQTIILTYSNNRNLQNSNHNCRDLGGINQSCRFNSILNIDEMCFGSLALAWQGQGSCLSAQGRWRGGLGSSCWEGRHLSFKLVAERPGREWKG